MIERLKAGESIESAICGSPFYETDLSKVISHGQLSGRLDREPFHIQPIHITAAGTQSAKMDRHPSANDLWICCSDDLTCVFIYACAYVSDDESNVKGRG